MSVALALVLFEKHALAQQTYRALAYRALKA